MSVLSHLLEVQEGCWAISGLFSFTVSVGPIPRALVEKRCGVVSVTRCWSCLTCLRFRRDVGLPVAFSLPVLVLVPSPVL